MYSYVARQPIVDRDKKICGYELLFRDNENNTFPKVNPDIATSKIVAENELTLGFKQVTDNQKAFINFPTDTLINNFPDFIDPDSIIIEILEDIEVTPELVKACQALHQRGFIFALDDYDFNGKWAPLIPLVTILKVDIHRTNILQSMRMIRQAEYSHVEWLAEKVETEVEFVQYSSIGYKYFQGYYISKPEILKKNKATMSQHLVVELIAAISGSQLDYDKLESLFAKDITLTYKLLRYLNNANQQLTKEVESIRHALVYLGQDEVKKYMSLLLVANLTSADNNDLVINSLVRAKFCELLLTHLDDNDQVDNKAFLIGMLSQIDVILGQKLEYVLNLIPLHTDIKSALLEVNCDRAKALQLARALETSNEAIISQLSTEFELEQNKIAELHQSSSNWAQSIL